MEKSRLSSKLLSFIMAFLILLVSLPTYALASLVPEDTSQGLSDEQSEEASFAQGELVVLEEDISLREENVKHFKLSNGTVKAVSYATPVHYLDADGNWIDIDNSFTLNGSEYTANNKQEIKFANKSGSNGLLSIKDGEYKIDFTPLNTNKVSVEIENPQGNNSRKFDDVKKLNNIVSKATYSGIYDGIDLEYILVGNNIKENIIVNEKQDEYTYSFEIKLNKLNATLENNAIILTDYNTGEKVYEIPAPYMLDANGEYSDSVEYTLTQNSKWKYTFTVKADPSWINDDERAFPVKIDPTVIVNSNITDLFVMQYDGLEHNYPSLIVGDFVGNKDTVAFIKFHNTPSIPSGAKLVDVKLALQASSCVTAESQDAKIGVFPASADWTAYDAEGNYQITHANRTNYYDASNLIDYLSISEVGIYRWNITKLYKEWKSNPTNEYGLCIKCINLPNVGSSSVDGACVHFASSEAQEKLIPTIEITYTSMKGIEDYYSYYTIDAGVAGNGYVNAYDGNLTMVAGLTTTADEILPYSVGAIYDNATGTWGYSFNEKVEQDTQLTEITRYKWTDNDGTEHWFSPYYEYGAFGQKLWYTIAQTGIKYGVASPTEYYDEDGLGLTLKIVDGVVNISDQMGNKKVYNSNGTLNYIEDTFGNARYFHYSNEKLVAITLNPKNKGSILQLSLEYNSQNKLSSVFNEQSKTNAVISWSGEKITQIQYKSTLDTETILNTALYRYNEFGRLSSIIDGKIINIVNIEYSPEQSWIVSKIKTFANGNSNLSGVYEISYEENKTIFKDIGNDTSSADDDMITEYVFDSKARVISVKTYDDLTKTTYGSKAYTYYDKYEEANVGPKIHNNVKNVISFGTSSPNILTNPDFVVSDEELGGWQISGSVVATGTTLGEYTDPLKLSRASIGTTTLKQTLIYLETGKYTFSAYLNRHETSEDSQVCFKILNSQNQIVASESFAKHQLDSDEMSSYWEREELRFDIETSGIYSVVIEFSSATNEETLYVDNAMLEKAIGASTFSIYSDGDFGSGYKTLSSTPLTTSSYEQKINLPWGSSLSGWMISAWVKVDNSVPSANTESCSAKVGIRVVSSSHEQFIPVDTECTDWQYISMPLTYDPDITCPPTSLFVYLVNDYNIGDVHFDKISLCKLGSSAHYTYNGLGNVYEITNNLGQKTTYVYGNGNAIDVTSIQSTSTGTVNNAIYDNKHNVQYLRADYSALSSSLATNITRNEQGQVTTNTTNHASILDQCMVIDNAYITDVSSANYSKVEKITDERGNETQYFYTENGLLKGVCLNNDEGTLYDYNPYGELIKVSLAKYNAETNALEYADTDNYNSIDYEYGSKSELKAIITKTTEYNFTYDVYGNIVSITIGDNELTTSELIELVSYEYEQNNGNLTSLNYGNGVSVQYLYDNLDRVVGICYNQSEEEAIIYTYGVNGQISSAYDVSNSVVYNYYYNADGTLSREKAKKNGTTLYERIYTYNSNGSLAGVDLYCLDDNLSPKNSINYTYDSDNRLTKITNASGEVIEYTYDVFGLVTSKTTSYSQEFTLQKMYAYANGRGEEGQSTLVDKEYTFINGERDSVINYTYDDRGNITNIVDGDGYYFSYEYDDKNQLIRENNQRLGYTYLYMYDASGNMTCKETRAYTTAPTEQIIQTAPQLFEMFSFGNSVWKDCITTYSVSAPLQGQSIGSGSITYDGIGNPLTYYNGNMYSFVWEEGRQLASATIGSNTYTYKYNHDGVRIEKTIGAFRYEYIVYGTRIERERVYDGTTLKKDSHFYYDASGNVSSAQIFVYGTTVTEYKLLFSTNIQGDITEIYTADGTSIMSFTYDAWGKVYTTENATNASLLQIARETPFRYRGYFYDSETSFYYLNSRYYDPQMMRFINADNNFASYNLYMYCGNNPVNRADYDGEHWYYLWIDDLLEAVDELMASVSNIVFGQAAFVQAFYDPQGAVDLWNSRPFQDIEPSTEMQIFTEIMYNQDIVTDLSVSVSISEDKYLKAGVSKVFSPNKNINSTYFHIGVGESTPSKIPVSISYSVGFLSGIKNKDDYEGISYNTGVQAFYGVDFSWSATKAFSFTISNGYGIYGGTDFYWCLD